MQYNAEALAKAIVKAELIKHLIDVRLRVYQKYPHLKAQGFHKYARKVLGDEYNEIIHYSLEKLQKLSYLFP